MIKKVLLLVLFLFASRAGWAQPSGTGNQNIIVNLNTGLSVANNSFTNNWEPKPALYLNVQVPFYRTRLEAGARYMRFNGMAPTETDSDYNSFFLHLGWLYPIQLAPKFKMMPALRFGGNLMLFDESETYESGPFRYVTDPNEFEFAYEIALRNEFQISEHFYLHATVSYNHTLTEIPLPVTLISAGVSFSFDQPTWLKNFVQ